MLRNLLQLKKLSFLAFLIPVLLTFLKLGLILLSDFFPFWQQDVKNLFLGISLGVSLDSSPQDLLGSEFREAFEVLSRK